MVCLHTGTMGSILRAFLSIGLAKSLPWSGITPRKHSFCLVHLASHRAPTGERQEKIAGLMMRIASPDSVRNPWSAVCSEIPRHVLFASCAGEKNGLWGLRESPANFLRSQVPSRARSLLWRHSGVPGVREPSRVLPELRHREARDVELDPKQALYINGLQYIASDHICEYETYLLLPGLSRPVLRFRFVSPHASLPFLCSAASRDRGIRTPTSVTGLSAQPALVQPLDQS